MIISDNRLSRWYRPIGIVKLLFQYSLLTVADFIFDKYVSRDTPDMTPLKFSKKRA